MQRICHVCGNPLGRDDAANCMICGRDFHLAETQNSPIKDCGEVWISAESQALRFMCNDCIKEGHPQA